MSKAEGFKKWFKDHQGHTPQLRTAYEAIEELEGALSFACESDNGWIEIDTPEDIDCDVEVLLWDGCDHHIDYVETDIDSGVACFANGAKEITHYKLLGKPTIT